MPLAVVPDSLIAERRRLGLDKKDEMWEGVLHMNEPGSYEHQRMEARLVVLLAGIAEDHGLEALPEAGVFDPEVPDNKNFRTPDVVVLSQDAVSHRGIEGRATLVVEIRSPDDESFDKIGYYGRVGVGELLIIDRDTKEVRRWVNTGAELRETESGPEGWHTLDCLPVEMRASDSHLEVRTAEGTTVI